MITNIALVDWFLELHDGECAPDGRGVDRELYDMTFDEVYIEILSRMGEDVTKLKRKYGVE